MAIDTLQEVRFGGVSQRVRMRGSDTSNPVLLLMQQGPGLPIINEARGLERLLRLEEAFTVVYWDQRGTGLSAPPLRGGAGRFEISVPRMVEDTVSMLEFLHDRFGGRSFVAGFSFGATFAAYAAERRPDLVAALVGVGMDIDIPAAEETAYDFVLGTARERGNRRAVRQLEAIGRPPHLTVKQFATRARWAADFGGVTAGRNFNSLLRTLLASLLRSPDYSVADAIRALRGISASQAALLPELATTDLVHTMPRLEVPLILAQGRLDKVAPPQAAQRFHDSITAPDKQLVWFEDSAHTPHLDQPEKFRDLLMTVRGLHATRAASPPDPAG